MIKKQSDDADVKDAATKALGIITETLGKLPKAKSYDYGGHQLKIGEYDVCRRCSTPIAEAQAVETALRDAAEKQKDETVKEHLELAIKLFHLEAEAAVIRAEFHNGHGTEAILDKLQAYEYERGIGDSYEHSHHQGVEKETPWNAI
ncbi:hypothetical protein EYC59_01305 [Candidatus Saccharibacteria bacterium]|nr:MAG: hypothetical protein EYC59_01305 [Candidatus Saccharibacteria bacterium]